MADEKTTRRRPWLVRVFLRLVLLALLLAIAWYFRAPLLTGVANAWIIDEPPGRADAIVVLGGRPQYRPFEAARLFDRGAAPKVLVPNVGISPTDEMGLTVAETALIRQILVKQGVPESAIMMVGTNVHSTYEEAQAVREWAHKNKARTLIIRTDPFHTRRVDWLFGKLLKPDGVEVRTGPIRLDEYSPTDWWRDESGLVDFQSELLKSVYYAWKY